MNQVNYQKELEKILNTLQEKGEAASDYRPPRLFLHSCCAPCSSYCLEYLCRYFLITVFYYNPNISFSEEYRKRVAEQKRLIAAYNKEEKTDGFSSVFLNKAKRPPRNRRSFQY
jgi:predicted adenine nucleotide alpha hydrolase (AANH) superfamily ATPase